jgi:hypothetical protein
MGGSLRVIRGVCLRYEGHTFSIDMNKPERGIEAMLDPNRPPRFWLCRSRVCCTPEVGKSLT